VFSFSSWVTVLLPWQCRGSSATSPTLTMAPHSWEQLGAKKKIKKNGDFPFVYPFFPNSLSSLFFSSRRPPQQYRRRRREQARPGLWRDATGEATPCTRLSAAPLFPFFEKRKKRGVIHIMFASFPRLPLVTHPRPPLQPPTRASTL
jgi:hypothetical protein